MTALRFGSATDTGVVRTNNEDSLLVAEPLFAVADGMGGHAGGEVASTVAVETLRAAFSENSTVDGLVEAVRRSNQAVLDRAEDQPELRGMGTTLTALALVEEEGEQRLALVNVGDSRAYLLQHGELTQLTEDHSLVEELVREGQMSPAEAAVHPQRHIVTRALGMGPGVEPDVWQILPYKGDRILLCSDGLPNEVGEEEIATTLRREADPDQAAARLVSLARQHGGADNITVVVVDVVDDDDRAREASAAVSDTTKPKPPPKRATVEDRDLPAAAAPAPEATKAPKPAKDPKPPKPPRPRRLTFRVVLFIMALLVVLALAAGAFFFYGRGGYYVGLDSRHQVTIFKGRPGGLLWIKPTVAEHTDLTDATVLPAEVAGLRSGHTEPSLSAARTYVSNLRAEAAQAGGGAPPATTTPPPATTASSTP